MDLAASSQLQLQPVPARLVLVRSPARALPLQYEKRLAKIVHHHWRANGAAAPFGGRHFSPQSSGSLAGVSLFKTSRLGDCSTLLAADQIRPVSSGCVANSARERRSLAGRAPTRAHPLNWCPSRLRKWAPVSRCVSGLIPGSPARARSRVCQASAPPRSLGVRTNEPHVYMLNGEREPARGA